MGATKKPWYFRYIKSRIDQVWGWSPDRRLVKKRALVGRDEKRKEYWRCEKCARTPLYKGQYEVDHIAPRVNPDGWDGWDLYINRSLECGESGLQLLCIPCHKAKSESENARRPHRRGK